MTELPKLGQESIHETFRILVPGYFALFSIYTLFPELFEGERGVALALIGGVGLGIIFYGLNLHAFLFTIEREDGKRKFGVLLNSQEKKKIRKMITIVESLSSEEEKTELNNLTKDLKKNFGFFSQFWTGFSYEVVNESVRARQRIHASLFYLYANCSLIMLGYVLFVLAATIGTGFSSFVNYHPNLYFDISRVAMGLVLAIFFWVKAKEELNGSMCLQKNSMYVHHKALHKSLSEIIKLHSKTKQTEESKDGNKSNTL